MLDKFELFDSHLHIIDNRFPLVPNNGYLPQEFTCSDYLRRMAAYRLCGGAVVSGSFQAFDQYYLLDALNRLGPSFVGVTQLPTNVTDEDIIRLDDAGVRAVRFNLMRGMADTISQLFFMAHRVYELTGWHVELYVDSKKLPDMYDMLLELPAVVIDHFGLSRSGLGLLTRLAERGVRIKASGFGRVDFEVKHILRDIYSANPQSMMFGTDLPSTRARRPYNDDDFHLVVDALGIDGARAVFSLNAISFYHRRRG